MSKSTKNLFDNIPKENQESLELVKELSFCVFDLETTGGNHKQDKIIEIGLVKVENLKIVEQKNYLIQPEIKIPEFIQKLTSITPETLKDAPLIESVIDEILEIMGDSILVAHNTSFDVPFFNSVLIRLGKEPLRNRSICTHLMTKYMIPSLMNSNLNYMSKLFNIKHNKAHRALDDANATAELLLHYLKIFIKKNIKKVNNLYYPRNRFELDRENFKKGDSLESIEIKIREMKIPYLITVKGENGVIIFAMPSKGSGRENEYIIDKLKNLNYEMVTLKIIGPFIETLLQFNGLYNKLEQNLKVEVMNKLWLFHLEHRLKDKITKTSEIKSTGIQIGDFIICNHLVPEQFMIIPCQLLNLRSQLVFRYPGHEKKLIQFINSRSAKIANSKVKRSHLTPWVSNFFETYVQDCQDKEKECFVFKKGLPQKHSREFFEKLNTFLANNPNSYNYPTDYI